MSCDSGFPRRARLFSFACTGATYLRYLYHSTMIPTEVVRYLDSKKIAAVGSPDVSKGILGSETTGVVKVPLDIQINIKDSTGKKFNLDEA